MADHQLDFSQLYEEQIWNVYAFCAYRALNRDDAEDLTQQTFERALRAFSRYDPSRSKPRTWLLAIAQNLIIDHHRRRRASPEVAAEGSELEAAGGEASPEESMLGIDPDLEAALGRLGEQQREVIALRYGADLSGPEVAELTGLSLANVQQISSRALRQLRAELEAGGAESPQ